MLQKVIYIDSVLFINFVMDLMLLDLTVRTLGKTATFRRLSAGSMIGAAGYCLILCLPDLSYFFRTFFGMIPVALIMVKIGCSTKGIKELCRAAGYIFTYAFLIGGFMLFLFKTFPYFEKHGESILLIAGTGHLGFLVCRGLIKRCKARRQNSFCSVMLEGDEGLIHICGLIDTGNGLVEPISGSPVAIMEAEVWEKMEHEKRPEKFKVIPFHSIGKESGVLEGYEVEKIKIEYDSEKKELTGVTIAVFQGKLSVKGDYQIILPPQWSF